MVPTLGAALSRLSAHLPWSGAEVLILTGVGLLLGLPLARLLAAREDRRSPWREGLSALADLATILCGAGLVFDLLWGAQYARPDLAVRLRWEDLPAPPGAPLSELVGLAQECVEETNVAYLRLRGAPEREAPTPRPDGAVDAALENGFSQVEQSWPLVPGLDEPRGRAKPVFLSVVLSAVGLSGFYFPWTGEASYNAQVPGCALPVVIAHEKAHQRGIAPEDEAEFAGTLAALLSGHPHARYAGLLHAQRQLLLEILGRDEGAAAELVGARLPGVQEDVNDLRAFWERHAGAGARVGAAVNDTYLRAQGVPDGVESYGRGVRLLVLHSRALRRGGLAAGTCGMVGTSADF